MAIVNPITAIIYPINPILVAYYKSVDNTKHIKIVIISEYNIHDIVAVHLYIKIFLKYLTNHLQTTKKISNFYTSGQDKMHAIGKVLVMESVGTLEKIGCQG